MTYKQWALDNPTLTYGYKVLFEKKQRLEKSLLENTNHMLDWEGKDKRFGDMEKMFRDMVETDKKELIATELTLSSLDPNQWCIWGGAMSWDALEKAILERFYILLETDSFEYLEDNTYGNTSYHEDDAYEGNYFFGMNALESLRKIIWIDRKHFSASLYCRVEYGYNKWVCVINDGNVSFTRCCVNMCSAISYSLKAYLDHNWDELIKMTEPQLA